MTVIRFLSPSVPMPAASSGVLITLATFVVPHWVIASDSRLAQSKLVRTYGFLLDCFLGPSPNGHGTMSKSHSDFRFDRLLLESIDETICALLGKEPHTTLSLLVEWSVDHFTCVEMEGQETVGARNIITTRIQKAKLTTRSMPSSTRSSLTLRSVDIPARDDRENRRNEPSPPQLVYETNPPVQAGSRNGRRRRLRLLLVKLARASRLEYRQLLSS